MKSFSHKDRSQNLNSLNSDFFDLVIVGGGINGAGIARDAALRGMKVALIEANDFASGTSSRSSKLVHGGIRYLENYEFHLVFEALSERQKLFEMAPHLVHPLRFMIPMYSTGRVGMNLMSLGMWAYDALSLFRAPQLHERLSVEESLERMPTLQSKNLLGSFEYSDAYMDDDRLVHESLRSAHHYGAKIANYVLAKEIKKNKDGQVVAITAFDKLGQKSFSIKGKHFISTVGAWTDQFGKTIHQDWKNRLRPTKGVHLTFDKNRFPLSRVVVMGAESRIVFGIPRHDMVIIGTTDTDFKGDPATVTADHEDVHYLLNVIAEYFPGSNIKKQDIVGVYAGVRPLVQDDAESEGKTSREHSIFTDPCGVTFVAGGKYTTYRLISEQAVQHCLGFFSIEDRVRFNRCQSEQPINPLVTSESFSDLEAIKQRVLAASKLTPAEAQILAERHGPEAIEIINLFGNKRRYYEYEALHSMANTMCLNLTDFCARRVPLFLADKNHGLEQLDLIGKVFQEYLMLSDSQIAAQKQDYKAYLDKELKCLS